MKNNKINNNYIAKIYLFIITSPTPKKVYRGICQGPNFLSLSLSLSLCSLDFTYIIKTAIGYQQGSGFWVCYPINSYTHKGMDGQGQTIKPKPAAFFNRLDSLYKAEDLEHSLQNVDWLYDCLLWISTKFRITSQQQWLFLSQWRTGIHHLSSCLGNKDRNTGSAMRMLHENTNHSQTTQQATNNSHCWLYLHLIDNDK